LALKPAGEAEVTAALAESGRLGLFFGLRSPQPEEQAWQPSSVLYAAAPGPLDDVLSRTQAALGGCEQRVAASLFFQGFAARLLSPLLGCLATSGCVPSVAGADLRWRYRDSLELALIPARGWTGPPAELAPVVLTDALATHLNPLATAIQARVKVPAALLAGNTASAYVAALYLLGPDWSALAPRALASAGLTEAGTFEPAFVRRSCCLYYRVDGGGYCGDCPLRPLLPVDGFERPPGRRHGRAGAEQAG
jgi:hypothetical protein